MTVLLPIDDRRARNENSNHRWIRLFKMDQHKTRMSRRI